MEFIAGIFLDIGKAIIKKAIENDIKGRENLSFKVKYQLSDEDGDKIGHFEVKATNVWDKNIYLKKITLEASSSNGSGIILSSLSFAPHEKLENGQEKDYDIGMIIDSSEREYEDAVGFCKWRLIVDTTRYSHVWTLPDEIADIITNHFDTFLEKKN